MLVVDKLEHKGVIGCRGIW